MTRYKKAMDRISRGATFCRPVYVNGGSYPRLVGWIYRANFGGRAIWFCLDERQGTIKRICYRRRP